MERAFIKGLKEGDDYSRRDVLTNSKTFNVKITAPAARSANATAKT